MKGSTGGYIKFSKVKGAASATGVVVWATAFSLDMSADVCKGGPAASTWGFRDMGTQWNVLNLDLTPNSGASIYYVVGDSTAESAEHEFKIPPAPGSTSKLNIIACAPLSHSATAPSLRIVAFECPSFNWLHRSYNTRRSLFRCRNRDHLAQFRRI